jgi:hypothetical protein
MLEILKSGSMFKRVGCISLDILLLDYTAPTLPPNSHTYVHDITWSSSQRISRGISSFHGCTSRSETVAVTELYLLFTRQFGGVVHMLNHRRWIRGVFSAFLSI